MSFGNNSKSVVTLDQIQHGEETQYQLRPRDAIWQPKPYASQDQEQTNTDIIKNLWRKRAGKKGLITKKIQQIKAFITERGSQTKIKFLQETASRKSEVLNIPEELMGLLQENDGQYGDEWIEEINFEVDDCCSDVNGYLTLRKYDPPSETMSKASIVDKYIKRSVRDESLTQCISDLTNQLNKMSVKMHQNSEK